MNNPKDSKEIASDLYDKKLNGDKDRDWPGIDRESFVEGYASRDAEVEELKASLKWVTTQRDDLMIHYKEVLKLMLIANDALRSISHSGSRSKLADEAYEAWVQTCDAPRPFVEDES